MENDPQRVARSAVYPAHSVPQIHAVISSRTFHRPVARGENDRLTAIGEDHLRFGLRSRLLLDEDEFSAFPVAALLAEQEHHLQRKAYVTVKILMKTVIASGFVVKHQWCRFGLPGLVTNLQKSRMLAWISQTLFTERLRPMIGDICEMRISAAPDLCDQFRQRFAKYL